MNQVFSMGNSVLEQVLALQGRIPKLPTDSMIVMIAAIAVGLIVGLFGIKLVRLFTAVAGLGFGAMIGLIISENLGIVDTTAIIIVIGCAVVFAFLSSFFVRIGTFITIFFLGLNLCTAILNPDNGQKALVLICFCVPFVIALISAILYEPVIIILTGVAGGVMTGFGVVTLGGKADIWWMLFGMCAGFAVIGMMVQIIINGMSKGRSFKGRSDSYDDEVQADEDDDDVAEIGDDTVSINLDEE